MSVVTGTVSFLFYLICICTTTINNDNNDFRCLSESMDFKALWAANNLKSLIGINSFSARLFPKMSENRYKIENSELRGGRF